MEPRRSLSAHLIAQVCARLSEPIASHVSDYIQISYLVSHTFFVNTWANVTLGSTVEGEEISEELLLRPLPDRKVLAHFHFQSKAPPTSSNGRHHHLSPKLSLSWFRNFV